MAISDAALNALLIETRSTLSQSPLSRPIHDDQQTDLERRCREVIESEPNLELATWLVEAWTVSRGLEGLRTGLQLVTRLLDEKWDPTLDWHDHPTCSAELSALDKRLSRALLAVPVTTWRGLDLRGYLDLRLIERFSKDQMEEYARVQPEGPADVQALAHAWNETRAWYFAESSERLREVTSALNEYVAIVERRVTWNWYGIDYHDLPRTRGLLSRLEKALREAAVSERAFWAESQPEQASEQVDTSTPPAASAEEGVEGFQIANREQAVRQLLHTTLFVCNDDPDGLACLLLERAVRLAVNSRYGWLAELKLIERRIKNG